MEALERIKQQLEHVDRCPSAMSHCNGVDFAYFRPDDVRGLVAEVEHLTALVSQLKADIESDLCETCWMEEKNRKATEAVRP